MRNTIAVVRAEKNYNRIGFYIARAIELIQGLDIARKYERIVVKINLCDFRDPNTGAITHPLFLDAFLKYLRENFPYAEIYVVESDASIARPDLFVRWFGFNYILEKWKAKWVNLTKCVSIKKRIKGRYFSEMDIPVIFDNSFFITLPKLKTSTLTKITCALKNQFGCLPYPNKSKFHKYIDDVIVDANLAFPPHLCLVDGVIGMVGTQGPAFGVPLHMQLIVAGADPVAVDSLVARTLGFNPYFIGHLRKASLSKVGSMLYDVIGDACNAKVGAKWSCSEFLTIKIAQWIKSKFLREEE